jgi:hypothetical protein
MNENIQESFFSTVKLQQLPHFQTNKILPNESTLGQRYTSISTGGERIALYNEQRARTFTKIDPETGKVYPEYESFKQKLPVYLPHSLCSPKIKSGDNVSQCTGLMFYEWDCKSKTQAQSLKDSLIYKYGYLATAIYLTASAEGVAMEVMTNLSGRTDISPVLFKEFYWQLAHSINLTSLPFLFDPACGDIVRNSCLSYDPNIYVNSKCQIFLFDNLSSYSDSVIISKVSQPQPIQTGGHSVSILLNKGEYIDTESPPKILLKNLISMVQREMTSEEHSIKLLFYNNISDVECQGLDYKVYDEKQDFYPVFKRNFRKDYKTKTGKRTNLLFAICRNLVLNNIKTFDSKKEKALPMLFQVLNSINKCHCENILNEIDLCKIITSVYNYYQDGILTSRFNKKKLIAWNEKCKLTSKEKQSIGATVVNQQRGLTNTGKIVEVFNTFVKENGVLPTQKQVVELSGFSLKTVKRRWKDLIKEPAPEKGSC